MPRRRFLRYGAAAALTVAVGHGQAIAGAAPRRLSFFNLHTGESIRTVYWADGAFVPQALDAIDHHLRDFRTDEVKPIDTHLLDLLHGLNLLLENPQPLHVISGYRSPRTNAMLAARSNQVSRSSFHMRGMAIDVRLPEFRLERLHRAALRLRRGGVGYYPSSAFVHLDTGPVRRWGPA